MKTYTAKLKSASPYTSSRYHGTPKLDTDTHDAHEQKTWREKLTVNDQGMAVINAMAFKFAMTVAAKKLGMKIPGKGNAKYAGVFESGILITEHVNLGIPKDDVEGITIHVNADGVRGSGKRVMKTFPIIKAWAGDLVIHVLDEQITAELLMKHLDHAGKFVGVGQFRAERGGTNGRFSVEKLTETKG